MHNKICYTKWKVLQISLPKRSMKSCKGFIKTATGNRQDRNIARVHDCMIARLQDCTIARLHDCMIA
jgi:hypothetical protein